MARNMRHKWRAQISKSVKNAPFGVIWVPVTSMEGFICIGTNRDDAQTPLGTVY